ncbi:MAG: hypothetical protein EOM78_22720 [Erysipelotrichia bacterium]|nr:hypothetical protein [Erysipelotrichia bacterium]
MKELQNLIIKDTDTFNKAVKKLKKKYIHIENDYMNFVNDINNIDDLGINLGNNIYKVRIKNSDKNSGKSSGYRLISYLKLIENELYLMFIYDKSEIGNINEKEIDKFILELTK